MGLDMYLYADRRDKHAAADKLDSLPPDEKFTILDLAMRTGNLLDDMVKSGQWDCHLNALLASIAAAEGLLHDFPRNRFIPLGRETLAFTIEQLRLIGETMKGDDEDTEEA